MDDATCTSLDSLQRAARATRLLRTLSIVSLVFALSACTDPTDVSRSDPQIDAFFQHTQTAQAAAWLEEEAPGMVAPLSNADALKLAERALTHSDAAVRIFGLQLIYQRGFDDRGDQAAASLLLRGDDLTGLGWGWMHSGDPTLLERRLRGIRAAVSSRSATLRPDERKAAEAFLCEGREACIGKDGPETTGP